MFENRRQAGNLLLQPVKNASRISAAGVFHREAIVRTKKSHVLSLLLNICADSADAEGAALLIIVDVLRDGAYRDAVRTVLCSKVWKRLRQDERQADEGVYRKVLSWGDVRHLHRDAR